MSSGSDDFVQSIIGIKPRRTRQLKPRQFFSPPRQGQTQRRAGKAPPPPVSQSIAASHLRPLHATATPPASAKIEALSAWAASMADAAVGPATTKSRELAVTAFYEVAREFVPPSGDGWIQPTQSLLIPYVEHLVKTKDLKAQTVRVYMSQLHQHTLFRGQPDYYINGRMPPYIAAIIDGIEREQALVPGRVLERVPVTTSMTLQIIAQARASLSPFSATRFIMLVIAAFMGAQRLGDMVPQTALAFDPALHLCMPDVAYQGVKLEGKVLTALKFAIKSKKTDRQRKGSEVVVFDQAGEMSIKRAHEAYMMQRSARALPSWPSAYFIEEDGTPTTTRSFRKELAAITSAIDGLPKGILPHSFRKGAATTLSAHGFSDATIAALGSWKSDCFRKYISKVAKQQNEIFKTLATSTL